MASDTSGSIAQRAISSILGSLGGGGGMGLGVSAGSSSGATSGDAMQGGGSTGEDFAVNFGNGVTQGGGVPTWIYAVGLAVAALVLLKHKKKG